MTAAAAGAQPGFPGMNMNMMGGPGFGMNPYGFPAGFPALGVLPPQQQEQQNPGDGFQQFGGPGDQHYNGPPHSRGGGRGRPHDHHNRHNNERPNRDRDDRDFRRDREERNSRNNGRERENGSGRGHYDRNRDRGSGKDRDRDRDYRPGGPNERNRGKRRFFHENRYQRAYQNVK